MEVGKHVSHTLIYRSGEREGRKVGKEGKGREREGRWRVRKPRKSKADGL